MLMRLCVGISDQIQVVTNAKQHFNYCAFQKHANSKVQKPPYVFRCHQS